MRATARACANIAFIKYWGTADAELNLPLNGSLSMALAGLTTTTTVAFSAERGEDSARLNGAELVGPALDRVSRHLDRLRTLAGVRGAALVDSRASFPLGAGLASSASAFAALTLAGSVALGLRLEERELSRMARLGSGSASRSVPGGFAEWLAGGDEESFAHRLAPPEHWELWDVIALVDERPKAISSLEGHRLAPSSPFLPARLERVPSRLAQVRRAVLERDFALLAELSEEEALELHLVAMSSRPGLLYWQPGTVEVLHEVRRLRAQGLPVFFTIDAGANVHCLTPAEHRRELEERLSELSLVARLLSSPPGPGARLLEGPEPEG